MFGTTRIPQKKHDIICYGKDLSEWARHIIVTRNGHVIFCILKFKNFLRKFLLSISYVFEFRVFECLYILKIMKDFQYLNFKVNCCKLLRKVSIEMNMP